MRELPSLISANREVIRHAEGLLTIRSHKNFETALPINPETPTARALVEGKVTRVLRGREREQIYLPFKKDSVYYKYVHSHDRIMAILDGLEKSHSQLKLSFGLNSTSNSELNIRDHHLPSLPTSSFELSFNHPLGATARNISARTSLPALQTEPVTGSLTGRLQKQYL